MGKRIAIILGAGASNDVVSSEQRGRLANEQFRLPLTKDLFSLNSSLEHYLTYYPKAHTAVSLLRSKLSSQKITLEKLLASLKGFP